MATLTVFPDAATSCDGIVYRAPNPDESFSVIRAGAGTHAVTSHTYGFAGFSAPTSGTNKYDFLYRTILMFDTSPLTASASISAAVLSLYLDAKFDDASNTPTADIYTSSPTSTTSLVAGDFGRIGTTSQTGAAKTYAGHTAGAYNDFTFDSTGRGNINKTGISMFAVREATYDVDGATPTWGSAADTLFKYLGATTSGTSQDPKLVITYTTAYTSSLAGAITPTGSVVKAISQALAGGLTPAGALSVSYLLVVSLAGALTPIGALSLAQNVAQAVGGALTATGDLILSLIRAPYNFGAFRDRRGKRWPNYPIGGPGPGRRRGR